MATRDCIETSLLRKASATLKRLSALGITVVTAESCTAGLIAAALSTAEGAAKTLHGSFVTYTKEAKHRSLGVPMTLLRKEGSVTRRVASDMLRGALRHSPADMAVAVTGVLGPEPDEDGNPVGLVLIGCQMRGSRPVIRQKRYGRKPAYLLRRKTVLDALRLLEETARASQGSARA